MDRALQCNPKYVFHEQKILQGFKLHPNTNLLKPTDSMMYITFENIAREMLTTHMLNTLVLLISENK